MKHAILQMGMSIHGLLLSSNLIFAAPQQVMQATTQPTNVEAKASVDLAVRAAGIEVAWLHHAATYPFFLRAEPSTTDESITLSGFVPNNQLRQKALSIAVRTALDIPLIDHITVQPNMALPSVTATSKDQASIVKEQLDHAVPSLTKQIQVYVDNRGIITITGRVDDFSDRRKIIRALQGIPGCTAVRYDLRIGGPPASPLVTQSASKEMKMTPVANKSEATSKTTWRQMPGKTTPANNPTVIAAGHVATEEKDSTVLKPATPTASSKPAGTPVSTTTSSKIETAQFTISSVSGLTPPSPGIVLGLPIINHLEQPNVLANVPALPLSPEKMNLSSMETVEITKSIVQVSAKTPAKTEPAPLPIIVLQPTTTPMSGNVEQITIKPR